MIVQIGCNLVMLFKKLDLFASSYHVSNNLPLPDVDTAFLKCPIKQRFWLKNIEAINEIKLKGRQKGLKYISYKYIISLNI